MLGRVRYRKKSGLIFPGLLGEKALAVDEDVEVVADVDANDLPAEDTEDQVQHEKGSDHNQGDKVDVVEGAAYGVVGLEGERERDVEHGV